MATSEPSATDGTPAAREEFVVLVDDDGQPSGTMPKAAVHTAETPLHLAFSVYVFDRQGRFLITRRALSKRTWPGVWTNSCCGHVEPGESPSEAARRRLAEELALVPETLDVVVPDFRYRVTSAEGIVENELCPVFVATVAGEPVADPHEVVEWRWTVWADFRATAIRAPWALSPWSVLQVAQLPASLAGGA